MFAVDGTSAPRHATSKAGCEVLYSGNDTRSGHFNSRSLSWKPSCSMTFLGRPTDIVHVSLFNYMLRLLVCIIQLTVTDEYINLFLSQCCSNFTANIILSSQKCPDQSKHQTKSYKSLECFHVAINCRKPNAADLWNLLPLVQQWQYIKIDASHYAM